MNSYNELPKTYSPSEFEDRIYAEWCEKGYFTPDKNNNNPSFSIVIPPPNVTGQLHMGHALDETLQDILVRYKRMQGFDTVWIPGTDHAGIATQIKAISWAVATLICGGFALCTIILFLQGNGILPNPLF